MNRPLRSIAVVQPQERSSRVASATVRESTVRARAFPDMPYRSAGRLRSFLLIGALLGACGDQREATPTSSTAEGSASSVSAGGSASGGSPSASAASSLRERLEGTYIVAYEDDRPSEIFFTGISGD